MGCSTGIQSRQLLFFRVRGSDHCAQSTAPTIAWKNRLTIKTGKKMCEWKKLTDDEYKEKRVTQKTEQGGFLNETQELRNTHR
jgi:hypothetical protein